MEAAEEVFVEKLGATTTVHFDTGYKKFISHFINGQFVDRVEAEHIPIRGTNCILNIHFLFNFLNIFFQTFFSFVFNSIK